MFLFNVLFNDLFFYWTGHFWPVGAATFGRWTGQIRRSFRRRGLDGIGRFDLPLVAEKLVGVALGEALADSLDEAVRFEFLQMPADGPGVGAEFIGQGLLVRPAFGFGTEVLEETAEGQLGTVAHFAAAEQPVGYRSETL